MTPVLIHAYDLATTCGWAEGALEDLRPGGNPRSGSHRFAPPRSSPDEVLGAAVKWFADRLALPPRPEMIWVEVPDFWNLGKGKSQGSSIETMELLIGLLGVVRGVANRRGFRPVSRASSAQVRRLFIQNSQLKGPDAKAAVFGRCAALGWKPKDDNASDALALLTYGLEQQHPGAAERTLPLFLGAAAGKQFKIVGGC